MQIEQIDPAAVSDDMVAGVHAVLAAAAAADRPRDPAPPLADVATRLREPDRRDRRMVHLVARTEAGPVGHASLWLSLLDNLRMGLADIQVHPDRRRRGVGTALLRAVVAELAAGGRTILLAETDAGGPGDAFARAIGARVVETDRLSLLRLADVDWAAVEAAAAAPHPGYRLVPVTGRIPDELIGSYARAKSAMNDAPHGETDLEAFEFDEDRVRAEEAAQLRREEVRVTFAVHADTGEVAGFTETGVGRVPERARQGDTAVVPAHRGSGLGLWIKAAMLLRLRAERPDVAEVITGNSTGNQHMLAINTRLGFRPWIEINGWQADVPELARRLAAAPAAGAAR
ncbi:MAG TPA: GNAT family N-acetyltransferase [Mycobacteriales bacterium]